MFTGSGMPMRFADTDGTMIDVYQSTTQMTDESGQTYPFTINTLLDRALGADGYYGAFNANMHTDRRRTPGADAIVASAKARGVPVVSAAADADLARRPQRLDVRRDRTGATTRSASASRSAPARPGCAAMVPATFGGKALQTLTRDGAPVTLTRETIKGVEYAFFAASAGAYAASYARRHDRAGDLARRRRSRRRTAPRPSRGRPTRPSDSRVDYGTSPTALTPDRHRRRAA